MQNEIEYPDDEVVDTEIGDLMNRDGDISNIEDLFDEKKYLALALFTQDCKRCELIANYMERSAASRKALNNKKCSFKVVFNDNGSDNDLLETVAENYPKSLAKISYVDASGDIHHGKDTPMMVVIDERQNIVLKTRLILPIERFCTK